MKVLLKTRRVSPLMLILLVGLLGLVGERLIVAHAANTTFNSCPDQTTLQNTINANPGNTIVFSISSRCTIYLTGGPIVINQSVTLDNQGQQVILDGQRRVQVIHVTGSATIFTLNALTIANGAANFGGGLENDNGTVSISNSMFANNTAAPRLAGGGLENLGGTVSISNSTFANNSAPGGLGGGLFSEDGPVSISNSTFVNNSAPGELGGGLYNTSDNGDSTVNIANSTFASNSAGDGGGLFNSGGRVNISNSTFANNSVGDTGGGGGLFNEDGLVNIAQSIVANNTATTGANCFGPITDQGYNLSNDTSCGFVNGVNGTIVTPNPMLGPLANNGGPTQTIALELGSPAIDQIPAPGVCKLSSDQRGFPRPDNGESMCDIGAYEFQDPPAPGPVPSVPPCQVSTDPAQGPNRDGSSQQDGVRSLTGAGTFCLNQNGRFVTTDISRR